MSEKVNEGWGKPGLAKKWHYFVKSRSLCGGWLFTGRDLEQGGDDHPDNCAPCRRKRAKMKEQEGESGTE